MTKRNAACCKKFYPNPVYPAFLIFLFQLCTGCGAAPPEKKSEAPAAKTVSVPSEASSGQTKTNAETNSAARIEASAEHTALQFWRSLAARDYSAAIAISSFPFDMDGAKNCLENASQMEAFFQENPLPEDKVMTVEDARVLETDPLKIKALMRDKVKRWTAPDARCLTPNDRSADDPEIINLTVDISVDNRLVKSLTRMRCRKGVCTAAGIDN